MSYMAKDTTDQSPFFGRAKELEILNNMLTKRTASLAVIKGRRRVGKSRLAEQFVKDLPNYYFVGLAPEKNITAQMQRDDFVRQMQSQLNIPGIKSDDWGGIFWHLANQTQQGRIVIVLDEINWMGDLDPTFLAKLKTAWDVSFKKNPNLILILSGSMSKWIEDNILSSTGFFGRVSTEITLNELSLPTCNQFWHEFSDKVSAYEKFKILSVTGGIPRYLEEIHPQWPAEKNIMTLCFHKEALLFKEFDRIFSDLFSKRSNSYLKIVETCLSGTSTLDDIAKNLGMKKGGTVSDYVEDLVETGYLSRDYTWNIKSGKLSKLCVYRLQDNYIRFYLKYIRPLKSQIVQDNITRPPAWDSIMGLQFENLVLNNRKYVKQALNLYPQDILVDNPYFQKATSTQQACQIDYMIQSRYNSFHLCEIKFSKNKITSRVINEVKEKINRLRLEKNVSIWPVLIHVNGVAQNVIDEGFFARYINFSDLFQA